MAAIAISVTEFSRGLSDFLNHVQYRGQVLDIERGKRIVARLSPVATADGFPIAQLGTFLAQAPRLSGADADAMARDVRTVRAQLRARPDPWA